MTTSIVVVRHGETEWNRVRRIQGHCDSALTAKGWEQAQAMRQRLTGMTFDAAFASDLKRAQLTAQCITPMNMPITSLYGLRERSFGDGEGLTYEEVDARFPGTFSRNLGLDPDYRIPNGESRRDLAQRVRTTFQDLAASHPRKTLLVVTHGGVLAALWRWAVGLDDGAAHAVDIPNVAYNRITVASTQAVIEVWGDVTHLAEVTVADAV
jgi:2,3-bisphosphoglycerate-dependent phosphoglycerate mutase